MDNYYNTLGVDPKASQAEIKERYRFLANAYHPDKFPNDTHKQHAEEEFKKMTVADVWMNPKDRKVFSDCTLFS